MRYKQIVETTRMMIDSTSQSGEIDGSGEFGVWIDQVRAFAERSFREIAGNRIMLFWVFGFSPGMYLLSAEVLGADREPAQQAAMATGIGMLGVMFVCLFVFSEQLVDRSPETTYELTDHGRSKFETHVRTLESLIKRLDA